MNRIMRLGGVVLCMLAVGCASDYSLRDSDSHSTKQVSPRETAQLSCLKTESLEECLKSKRYALRDETPAGIKVDQWGCPLDTDGDGVPDHLDKCPGTPRGALVDERGCWVIGDTLFDFDKYVIKPQYYPLLDQIISVLKKNPSLNVEIEGHTDNFGSQAYNQILSHRRANAIMNYLIQGGIDKRCLSAVGYDFSRPRASNETEEGRALNRRVQFHPLQ